MVAASDTVIIVNKKGLHARAAAKFVKCAERFVSDIRVHYVYSGHEEVEDNVSVCATSILGLMMLAAEPGSELYITASGEDAEAAIEAIKVLVSNKFGEDE